MADIYEVKITNQAREQMSEIIDYISQELFAPDAANNLLNKMEKSILALREFPEKNQLIDEEPWRTEGIRRIIVDNFLVYYWIDKAEKRIQVIAVIYSKRDQLEQLKNMKLDD